MRPTAYEQFIGKAEISFWVPIVTSAILLALSYGALLSKIALIEQRQLTMIDNQNQLLAEFRGWKSQAETRLGVVESRQSTVVSYLENHLAVRIVK